ncbi:solute carrier family 35 member F1-like protein [Tanacetum coccineum]
MMVNLFTKKTLFGLFLGQVLSLFITSTGFSSSVLSKRGINAPTSQSLANYVLLAIFYGIILVSRKKGMKAKWYYYLLLGLIDVEANYLVVKAYQYTSLTSVMLLDCWSIPSVIILTWLFLKTKYRLKKIAGVIICVVGLVLVIFSDVHASDRSQSGSHPIKGDLLVIVGATLYAVCNVSEEFFVKKADQVELLAMLGLFGAIRYPFPLHFQLFNLSSRLTISLDIAAAVDAMNSDYMLIGPVGCFLSYTRNSRFFTLILCMAPLFLFNHRFTCYTAVW